MVVVVSALIGAVWFAIIELHVSHTRASTHTLTSASAFCTALKRGPAAIVFIGLRVHIGQQNGTSPQHNNMFSNLYSKLLSQIFMAKALHQTDKRGSFNAQDSCHINVPQAFPRRLRFRLVLHLCWQSSNKNMFVSEDLFAFGFTI